MHEPYVMPTRSLLQHSTIICSIHFAFMRVPADLTSVTLTGPAVGNKARSKGKGSGRIAGTEQPPNPRKQTPQISAPTPRHPAATVKIGEAIHSHPGGTDRLSNVLSRTWEESEMEQPRRLDWLEQRAKGNGLSSRDPY